jgi:hypothetical protein
MYEVQLPQQDLLTIIKHVESRKQHNRRSEVGLLTPPTEKNTEEPLEAIVKHHHKLEYDFDQLVQKHNESLAQIN